MNSNTENARFVQNNSPSVSASANSRVWHCPQAGWVSDASGNHARGSTLHAIAETILTGGIPDPKKIALLNSDDLTAVNYAVNAVWGAIATYGADSSTLRTEVRFDIPGVGHTSPTGRMQNYVKADLLAQGTNISGNRIILLMDMKFGDGAVTWAYDDKMSLTATAVWSDMVTADPNEDADDGTELVVMVVNGDTHEQSVAIHPYDAMQDTCRRWAYIADKMMNSHDCPTGAGAHCVGCAYRSDCPSFEAFGRYYEQTRASAEQETAREHIAKIVSEVVNEQDIRDIIRQAIESAETPEQKHEPAKLTTSGKTSGRKPTRIWSYIEPDPDSYSPELAYAVGYGNAARIIQEWHEEHDYADREVESEEQASEYENSRGVEGPDAGNVSAAN